MPRELANPVRKPVPTHVALDSVEVNVTRTAKLQTSKMNVQASFRLYSAEGAAIERIGAQFSRDELSDEDAAALEGAYATLERIALAQADKKGVLPSADAAEADGAADGAGVDAIAPARHAGVEDGARDDEGDVVLGGDRGDLGLGERQARTGRHLEEDGLQRSAGDHLRANELGHGCGRLRRAAVDAGHVEGKKAHPHAVLRGQMAGRQMQGEEPGQETGETTEPGECHGTRADYTVRQPDA